MRLSLRSGALAAAGGAAATGMLQYRRVEAEKQPQQVFCWGRMVPASGNESVLEKQTSPVPVTFWSSQGLNVKHMSFGSRHGAAIDDRGQLWAWSDVAGPLPRQLPCTQLSMLASTDTALYAVTSRGKVLEWTDLADGLATDHIPAEPKPLTGDLSSISAAVHVQCPTAIPVVRLSPCSSHAYVPAMLM